MTNYSNENNMQGCDARIQTKLRKHETYLLHTLLYISIYTSISY